VLPQKLARYRGKADIAFRPITPPGSWVTATSARGPSVLCRLMIDIMRNLHGAYAPVSEPFGSRLETFFIGLCVALGELDERPTFGSRATRPVVDPLRKCGYPAKALIKINTTVHAWSVRPSVPQEALGDSPCIVVNY
jgi:hypothetical protein